MLWQDWDVETRRIEDNIWEKKNIKYADSVENMRKDSIEKSISKGRNSMLIQSMAKINKRNGRCGSKNETVRKLVKHERNTNIYIIN